MPTFKDHPCPTCGTVKYKRTADAGYACKYGHLMEGYREEQGDDDAAFAGNMKRRKVVSNDSQVKHRLYGTELEDAFKRIFQYGLQVMTQAFVKDLGFPPEFEHVVRELWLIYIHDSKVTLMNAYTVEIPNTYTRPATNPTVAESSMEIEEPEDLLAESDSDDNYNDDTPDTPAAPTTSNSKTPKRQPPGKHWPKIKHSSMIMICYIACVYLGWPVTLSDIRRWCVTLRLPYLKILKQLPKETHEMLDQRLYGSLTEAPTMHLLRVDTRRLINAYMIKCGVTLPKYNVAPLIFRYCTQLFLPVEMYFFAQSLYDEYPYTDPEEVHFNHTNVPADGFNYHNIETHIMATVLVAARFLYDMNDEKDSDQKYDIPGLAPPLPKKTWMKNIQANLDRWETIHRTKMIDSSEVDLEFILGFLNEATSYSIQHSQKEKKSLIRRYIMRMNDALAPAIHQTSGLDDLLTDVPRLSSTMDSNETDDNDTAHNEAKIIGDKYHRSLRAWRFHSKTIYNKEYETVILLASRIVDLPFEEMHARVVQYETTLFKRTTRKQRARRREAQLADLQAVPQPKQQRRRQPDRQPEQQPEQPLEQQPVQKVEQQSPFL